VTLMRTFPTRGVLARPAGSRVADVVVFAGAAALLWLIVRLAGRRSMDGGDGTRGVSTDPASSVLRGSIAAADVRGAGVVARVHVRLRHCCRRSAAPRRC
jgi:hypothetical protein